jgi:hypothetical protein
MTITRFLVGILCSCACARVQAKHETVKAAAMFIERQHYREVGMSEGERD